MLLSLVFTVLAIPPALAQLGQVWTEFQYYSVDLQNYLKKSLNTGLNPIESLTQNAIINGTGSLNIANPIDVSQVVSHDIILNSRPDKFENNPVLRSQLVSNQINRLFTIGSVVGILGLNGQIRQSTKLQNTELSLKNIAVFSQKSDQLISDLSQTISNLSGVASLSPMITAQLSSNQANLQLQSIKIQSEQAKIVGETLAETLQVNQSLQYSNLNLANISQQIEEFNRDRRLESATEIARLLRTTTQLDLLGTKMIPQTEETPPLASPKP